jgi:hypothetical protein
VAQHDVATGKMKNKPCTKGGDAKGLTELAKVQWWRLRVLSEKPKTKVQGGMRDEAKGLHAD